jgi:hypothetical protein
MRSNQGYIVSVSVGIVPETHVIDSMNPQEARIFRQDIAQIETQSSAIVQPISTRAIFE